MSALPSTSIVVPVFNGAATVADMLAAVVGQAETPDKIEIIVVDNGSTDTTRDIVRRFGVILLEEHTRGPSAARNRGLRHATGDVIVHLDADTVPTRRWLAEIVAPFRDPETTLVAGKSLSFPASTPAGRYLSRFQLYDAEKNITRSVLPFVASMNLAVRRDAALAVGGWNQDMMTSEDVDFCTRVLRRYPGPIRYAPDAVLFHRNRDTDAGLQRQAWTYGEGVADTYRRYPEIVPWGWAQSLALARNLVVRSAHPVVASIGHRLGVIGADDVEYAYYHRMWTWWFWRGFFSFYNAGQRSSPIP